MIEFIEVFFVLFTILIFKWLIILDKITNYFSVFCVIGQSGGGADGCALASCVAAGCLGEQNTLDHVAHPHTQVQPC